MKGCSVVLGSWKGRTAAARVIDGQLDDLLIDAGDDAPAPGTIFRARMDRPVKGQGGAFVTLEPGRTGFFRAAKGLAQGDTFLVMVTGYAEDGKAVPVTGKVLFKSRYVIVTPGAQGVNLARSIRDEDLRESILLAAHEALPEDRGGAGVILRSSCAGADAEDIAEDIADTWALAMAVTGDTGTGPERLLDAPDAAALAWRDWVDPLPDEISEAGFETHGLDDAIENLQSPLVRLEAGSAFVEPTRALVAVDVNTGNDTSPAAALKANLALARGLPRALRLRGLGGQIVIDPAPMPKKDRRAFEEALRAAFRKDGIETALVGWTPLGHYELQRKRERRPLGDLL